MSQQTERVILKFYIYSFLKSLLFFLPIVVIYFMNFNLTFTEIFILETIGAIGTVIFEVPTGIIADCFGKKKSLLVGMLVLIFSCLVFYFGSGFLVFAIGQLIWAFGGTLLSGADTALLYDVLHGEQKKDFKKYLGTARFIGLTGVSISSLVGGYISSYSMRITFAITAVSFTLCLLIIMTIKNSKEEVEKNRYIQIIKDSTKLIRSNGWILWLFLFTGVFGAVFNIVKPLSQVYMDLAGLDIKYFGIASSYLFLVAAISSNFANSFEKRFKNWSYAILGTLLLIFIVSISIFVTKLGILIFGVIFISMSISSIITEHELLKSSPSTMNATVLSFNNLFYKLLFTICSPIFGHYLGIFSFQKTMMFMGIILMILIPVFILGYQWTSKYRIRVAETVEIPM